MRRPIRSSSFLALALLVAPSTPSAALAPRATARQAPPPVEVPPSLVFAPPVEAEVTDGWRPPGHEYGPGNRGWEYATTEGSRVQAAGEGVVTYAGAIDGENHVTVAHRGGLRTSYSYLATIEVVEGADLQRGDPVGTSGARLHFGVRLSGDYVDPAVLFRPGALRARARLVATDPAD
jgi:murein DD-endopeptidase MepM/ murein hydrolase activator NlpD